MAILFGQFEKLRFWGVPHIEGTGDKFLKMSSYRRPSH